jgi:hypothetical protein
MLAHHLELNNIALLFVPGGSLPTPRPPSLVTNSIVMKNEKPLV